MRRSTKNSRWDCKRFQCGPVPEYASVLMDPSEANLPPIIYTVGCVGYDGPYYYIVQDDESMAISTPPLLETRAYAT